MRRREGGMILPALLILLLIGSIAVMLSGNDLASRVELQHHQATLAELSRARAALIGYAQSYRLTHPEQSVGYLPCPDTDSGMHDGNAEGRCGNAGVSSIGRFPYRTLGLPPLRDGHGECLWYAVAGSFKNNEKADTTDWDTTGQFNIADSGQPLNTVLHGDQQAVAVIFAPGRPLAGQNRGSSTRRCSGEADAESALQAYLESVTASPSSSPVTLTQGQPNGNINNDTLVWLSADDIFDANLIARSDFVDFINKMNTRLIMAVTDRPKPAPRNAVRAGAIEFGDLPAPMTKLEITDYKDEVGRPLTQAELDANATLEDTASWHGQYRYLRCRDSTPCLSWNSGSVSPRQCVAVIVFAGHRRQDQDRSRGISDVAAFFEGDNRYAVQGDATPFVGKDRYDPIRPSADVIQCAP